MINEAGKRLAAAGIEVSRVTKESFLAAKQKINPLLQKAGIDAGWTAGGAGSFDPEHPYPGTLRQDSGDIDIMIDPKNLLDKFPVDAQTAIQEWNKTASKPKGPAAIANIMADPEKVNQWKLVGSKAALANYMSSNGLPTDKGTLTVEYSTNGKHYSVDLIIRPKTAWPLHTHDFSLDPGMRGSDLWDELYATLTKISSPRSFTDPKSGETKGSYQFSPDKGLVDRDTGEVVTTDKDQIAKILLGPEANARQLSSLSGIKTALQKYPEKLAAIKHLLPQMQTENIKFGSPQWMRMIMEKL
jgi:hypothetical protein